MEKTQPQASSGASKPSGEGLRSEAKPEGRVEDSARDHGGSFPGTGWGDRRYDPVRETRFTADGPAVDHLVLRYEYASGLVALGIEPRRGWSHDRLRDRDGDLGFAPPPRW